MGTYLEFTGTFDVHRLAQEFIDNPYFMRHVSSYLADNEELCDNVAERVQVDVADVANHIDYGDLAHEIDTGAVAERFDADEIADHVDKGDIASNLYIPDIVSELDLADIAREIDMNDLAHEINVHTLGEKVLWLMQEQQQDIPTDLHKRVQDLETKVQRLLGLLDIVAHNMNKAVVCIDTNVDVIMDPVWVTSVRPAHDTSIEV